MWGGESGAMLKVVCGRGWRGRRFMCGDGGCGGVFCCGWVGGSCVGMGVWGAFLLRVDVEGCFKCNGRGTDKKQKRSHETEMTRSR